MRTIKTLSASDAPTNRGSVAIYWLALFAVCTLEGPAAVAAEPEENRLQLGKSRYHLFNPTPREAMRELSTDRPDKTESPITVDAGHFQFEMDLLTYTRDRDQSGGGDTRTDAWAIAPINLKLGLRNNLDFQVVLDNYQHVRVHDRLAGTVDKRSGFGDVTLRLKRNFWGNDGGKTAFALMPFVKLPANQSSLGNRAFEGGLIAPLGIELPRGWSTVVMAEVDFLRNDSNQRYYPSFINTITFGHDIAGRLAGYVEFYSEMPAVRGARWIGTADLGLTYGLSKNIQLDAGVNLGLSKAADDINPFLGLSWRF